MAAPCDRAGSGRRRLPGAGRADADGFLVGCPAGPDTELGSIYYVGGVRVTPNPNVPPAGADAPQPACHRARDPRARNLDTDADGAADLRWNLELGSVDLRRRTWPPCGTASAARSTHEPVHGDPLVVRPPRDRPLSIAPFRIDGRRGLRSRQRRQPRARRRQRVSLGYDTRAARPRRRRIST